MAIIDCSIWVNSCFYRHGWRLRRSIYPCLVWAQTFPAPLKKFPKRFLWIIPPPLSSIPMHQLYPSRFGCVIFRPVPWEVANGYRTRQRGKNRRRLGRRRRNHGLSEVVERISCTLVGIIRTPPTQQLSLCTSRKIRAKREASISPNRVRGNARTRGRYWDPTMRPRGQFSLDRPLKPSKPKSTPIEITCLRPIADLPAAHP
mmetsp:Transcript_9835/g.24510  ORF Transcript_9835/g.24510 Transcript_9835/m.24510 type:complete len:202 (+) Transcript_9835:873-1478(+)